MKLICQGKSVTQGTAVGSVIAVKDVDSAMENTNKNTILLLDNSNPMYCLLIMKAGGVIIREGGVLAHTCLLAMEMSVPCITQVGHEVTINDGQNVYLDASAGNVYEC